MVARIRPLVTGLSLLAAAATLLVSATSAISFGYRSPAAHVAIETAASVVAIVAAFLVLGRFRETRRAADLALLAALAVLGATNLVFSTALAIAGVEDSNFAIWASLAGRTSGAAALALAAFTPWRRLERPGPGLALALGGAAAVMGAAAVIGVAGSGLSTGIDPDLSPAASDQPRVVGSPGLLALQLTAMLLYTAAAVGFVRRTERSGDDLIAWFAVGATLAAFSRLNYFLFPSIFSNYVFTGDVLRFCFYLALLIGALRAIGAYQRLAAIAAIAGERRRIARELHDGLAQELAFISVESRRLRQSREAEAIRQIADAAERALDESRAAISALSRDGSRPLGLDLAHTAEAVAGRAGARVELALDEKVELPAELHVALVRIAREAMTNAVRHGLARHVSLSLAADGAVRLVVEDDGSGFDPASRPSRGGPGFGLQSMRERARGAGGDILIRSSPGTGTRVEVVIPWRPASEC